MQKILIPLDGSEHSDEVLDDVRQLLVEEGGLAVVLLRVVEPHPGFGVRGERDEEDGHIGLRTTAAERHLERVAAGLREAGASSVEAKVVHGDPALEILRLAKSSGSDLIAMATHGRSWPSRWLRGSVAERLLRASPTPLLLVNPGREEGRAKGTRFRKVLVPLDGSDLAASALPLATRFAQAYGAELLLARVVPPPAPIAAAEVPYPAVVPMAQTLDDAEEALKATRDQLDAGLRARTLVRQGSPAGELLGLVEDEDVDLVVMTTHGASGLDRWLFGSVAEKLARTCPVPLLVQRTAGGENAS